MRLNDALELLETPSLQPKVHGADRRHLRGACYLAGYAVECALKVCIINTLNAKRDARFVRWSQVTEHFGGRPNLRGARSHDLGLLLSASGLTAELQMVGMKASWDRCQQWSHDWRYLSDSDMNPSEARDFVAACRAVYDWIRQRTP